MGLCIFAVLFALLNRARGSQLFGLVKSTTEGRLASMAGMAMLTAQRYASSPPASPVAFMIDFALLYFWCVWRWDAYWGAAIGSSTHSRLWGILAMTARQGLVLPFYAFVSWQNEWAAAPWWGLSFLLMGVTYTISSKISPEISVIRNAELANGAIMGMTVWMLGA